MSPLPSHSARRHLSGDRSITALCWLCGWSSLLGCVGDGTAPEPPDPRTRLMGTVPPSSWAELPPVFMGAGGADVAVSPYFGIPMAIR